MLNHDFYEQTQTLQGALFQAGMALQTKPLATAPSPLLQLRRGFAESPAWFLVQAQEFEPEPLSVERIRRRAVWSSERMVAALLDLMASEKWLDRIGEDYHLTEDGRSVIQSLTERRHTILTPLISALPADHLQPLTTLIHRLLDAALASGTPPGSWSLAHSLNRLPAEDAPPVQHLFQHCADLNAWRDDCHMAAFQPLGVTAFAWEAFSIIWRGEPASATSIFDQLNHRGYSRSEYAAGLQDCVQRGWLQSADETFSITDAGREIREEAEEKTDLYYYRPWSRLNDGEAQQLPLHMTGLIGQLEALSKKPA